MTNRYDAWQLALANRDTTLVILAIIATSLVAAWCLVGLWPKRMQPWIRTMHLWAGLALWAVTLAYSVFSPLISSGR